MIMIMITCSASASVAA